MARLVSLVAAIALLGAGCGDPSRLTVLDDAVEATLALSAVEVDASGSTLLNTRPTGSFELEGVADLAGDRHAFTVRSTPVGSEGFTADVVAADDALLVRGLPTLTDGEWVQVTGAPEAHSADLALFIDVEALLTLVADLRGDVVEEGTQMIRGVETEQLSLRLPGTRLVRRINETIALVQEDLPDSVAESGDITAAGNASVWIDGDGLIRQLQLRVGAGLGATQAIPGTGAIDYTLLLSLAPVDEIPSIEVPEADSAISFGLLLSPQTS